MSFDKLGPTGHLIVGSVLDCSRIPFERALRDYDSQLYVRWNPKKKQGYGTWEVRRRPEKKSVVYSEVKRNAYQEVVKVVQGDVYEFDDGTTIAFPKYHETDVLNHIFDVSVLNYEILEKLKSIDTWNDKYYVDNLEYSERVAQVREEEKLREELAYNMKQHKSLLKYWKEMVLSGQNPAELAKYWK